MTHSAGGRASRCGVLGGGRGVGRVWRRGGRELRDHGGRGPRDGQAGGPRRRQGRPRRRSPRSSAGPARTYILALDRYGDVITAEAPTVGDVVTGGSDLREPRDDTLAAGRPRSRRGRTSPTRRRPWRRRTRRWPRRRTRRRPDSPEAPSSRRAAGAGGHRQPRRAGGRRPHGDAAGHQRRHAPDQASQQFNAAVVALEMAWMQLVVQAGCLDDEQRRRPGGRPGVHDGARRPRADAGYYTRRRRHLRPGTVDGRRGPPGHARPPGHRHGGQGHRRRPRRPTSPPRAAPRPQAVTSTAALQQTLSSPATGTAGRRAVDRRADRGARRFQTDLGVEPTGAVDAATVAAFETAIAAAKEPAPSESPSTESPSPTPTDPSAPTESPSST